MINIFFIIQKEDGIKLIERNILIAFHCSLWQAILSFFLRQMRF